jgi:sugar lactone lactonase YvrE
MKFNRRLRFAALLSACLFVGAFTASDASGGVSPVLKLPFPDGPESIAIDHHGNIYVSAAVAQNVLVIPAGTSTPTTLASFPGLVTGVRLDDAGNVFVAVVGSGVWELPISGAPRVQLLSGPGVWNGLAFDHRGNLYVSESGDGAIFRVTRDGRVSLWSVDPLLNGVSLTSTCGTHPAGFLIGANGVFFNKHGDMLINNTDRSTVVRIPVRPDGSAGVANILAGPDCRIWGADGGALDNEDNLYVTANAAGNIVRVGPDGSLQVIASAAGGDPLHFPTDIAFGTGHGDRKQALITNFDLPAGEVNAGLVSIDIGIPGRP